MTKLSIIVAAAADGAIGVKGDMPFYIKEDLRHFKQTTMGKPIIMGRKTFLSLPKGALPGRRNIVVTRDRGFTAPNIETAASIEEALQLAKDSDEAMIIGGGEIYRQAMDIADNIYLTRIHANAPEADTFFPTIDEEVWTVENESETKTDADSGVNFTFMTLRRK